MSFEPATEVKWVRLAALIEGASFLLLLGIAMPLKHAWGISLAVKIVGWVHGIAFMLLCTLLTRVMFTGAWPLRRVAMVFIAALLPFGPFVIERRLREGVSTEQI